MGKFITFIQCAFLACGMAILGKVCWQLADAFVDVNAPVTPALWIASAFLWFCSVSYAAAAIAAPFRKAH